MWFLNCWIKGRERAFRWEVESRSCCFWRLWSALPLHCTHRDYITVGSVLCSSPLLHTRQQVLKMSSGCFGHEPDEDAPSPDTAARGEEGSKMDGLRLAPLWTRKCLASRAATTQQDVDIILGPTGSRRAPLSSTPLKCWHGYELLKSVGVIRLSPMCPCGVKAITNFQGFTCCSI